jgi:glutathionyl-hydroquinone reductase
MFYYAFDNLIEEKYRKVDLYPEGLRKEIDETNAWVYDDVNNGVYKTGFASFVPLSFPLLHGGSLAESPKSTQTAYEKAIAPLFSSLDRLESHLSSSSGPYYFGSTLTDTDIRLYTTLVRFDPVYVQHFKCNIRDIRSGYPALHKWLRNLYWKHPAFKETTNFPHIKGHYTKSHPQINPHGITPVGPLPDILGVEEEVNAAEAVRK